MAFALIEEIGLRYSTDAGEPASDEGLGAGATAAADSGSSLRAADHDGDRPGLGLSICRDIVAGLGGTLQVEVTPGQGTVYRLDMPAAV